MDKLTQLIDRVTSSMALSFATFLIVTRQMALGIRHSSMYAICFALLTICCFFIREWFFVLPVTLEELTLFLARALAVVALFSITCNLASSSLYFEFRKSRGYKPVFSFVRLLKISMRPTIGFFGFYLVSTAAFALAAIALYLLVTPDPSLMKDAAVNPVISVFNCMLDVYVFCGFFGSVTAYAIDRKFNYFRDAPHSFPTYLFSMIAGTIVYFLQDVGVNSLYSVAILSSLHCMYVVSVSMNILRSSDGVTVTAKEMIQGRL